MCAEERAEAQRNVAAMRRVQNMYMPETRGDTLVDEKQKVRFPLEAMRYDATRCDAMPSDFHPVFGLNIL